jgi:hypothetical protein
VQPADSNFIGRHQPAVEGKAREMKLFTVVASLSDAPWYVVLALLVAYETTVLVRARAPFRRHRQRSGHLRRMVDLVRKRVSTRAKRDA